MVSVMRGLMRLTPAPTQGAYGANVAPACPVSRISQAIPFSSEGRGIASPFFGSVDADRGATHASPLRSVGGGFETRPYGRSFFFSS
jgi:hypothetical protein